MQQKSFALRGGQCIQRSQYRRALLAGFGANLRLIHAAAGDELDGGFLIVPLEQMDFAARMLSKIIDQLILRQGEQPAAELSFDAASTARLDQVHPYLLEHLLRMFARAALAGG